MARVALLLGFGLVLLAIGFAAGTWSASRRSAATRPPSDREVVFRERLAALDHHTELLERARQASLEGEHGLANIYSEAAERVLELASREE